MASLLALRGCGRARRGLAGGARGAALPGDRRAAHDEPSTRSVARPSCLAAPDSGMPIVKARAGICAFPLLNILIELAADEQRPDEVLRWYDKRSAKR